MSGSKLAMENREPKVSVIVPIYNTEKYLEEAVHSLMNQTLKDIEIILINDGSTDNSLDVISKLALLDSRIRVVSQKNGGLSQVRNLGVGISAGKYIYFMDSDDYIQNDTIHECFDKCEKYKLDFLFFDAEQFSENSSLKLGINYDRKGLIEDTVDDGANILEGLLDKKLYRSSACLVFINKEFYIKSGLGFYEGIIHEDELFTPQLYLNAERVGRIDKPFYKRRFREDSIMSSTFSMKNMNAYFTVSRELINLKSRLEKRKQIILNRLISEMLNAAIYKAHSLPFKDKLGVLANAIFNFAYYLDLKTVIVLLFKS